MDREAGFTYIEVVVAFVIFGLVFVFITQVGNNIFGVMEQDKLEKRSQYIATLELENYRSAVKDMSEFLSNTSFVLDSQTIEDGHIETRRIIANEVDKDFKVTIQERYIEVGLAEVTVTVEVIGTSKRVELQNIIFTDDVELFVGVEG